MNERHHVVRTVNVFQSDDRAFATACVTLKPLSFLVFAHEHITSDDGNIFPPLRRNETDVAMAVFQVALSDAAME